MQHLRAEAASLEVPSTSESTEAVVAGMKAVVPDLFQLCEAAVARCMRLTQGSEVQAVCLALDHTLESFIEKLKVRCPSLSVALMHEGITPGRLASTGNGHTRVP
jgi:hypothetical protein